MPDNPDKQEHPVAKSLRELGKIYDERSAVYGDNYLHFGKVMVGVFPHGITLVTEADHCRYSVFSTSLVKHTRYGQMFEKGGHDDSLDDASVYLQMLKEIDTLVRKGEMK